MVTGEVSGGLFIPKAVRNFATAFSMTAVLGGFAASAEAEYNPAMTKFPKAVGEQTLAMVSVDFEGQGKLPFGNEVVQEQVFDREGSVADYYHEASFGQFTLRGEVLGPITIPPSTVDPSCSTDSMHDLGAAVNEAVETQTGRNLQSFDHYGYTLPRTKATFGCDLGGLSFGNGFMDLVTRTKSGLTPHKFYEGVVVHEFGHNFGLSHANALRCHTQNGHATTFSIGRFIDQKCSEVDYGDPIDPMGQGQITLGTPPDMSAINKARLGWLMPQNITTIKKDGIATIAPLEVQTDKPQLVRVANGLTVDNKPYYFYMDFRQPTNLDSGLPVTSTLFDGVAIREAGPINDRSAEPLSSFTNFIDTTPKTFSAIDGTLVTGKTFKDSSTGISIKTLSVGPDGAKIRVSGLKKAKSH